MRDVIFHISFISYIYLYVQHNRKFIRKKNDRSYGSGHRAGRPRLHYHVHTNPSRKQSFSKTLFKSKELKTPALCFSVDGKHFENGAFRKRRHHGNNVISLTEFSSNTNPK